MKELTTTITLKCYDQSLIPEIAPKIASGGVNENVVKFRFCNLWNDCVKLATFFRKEDESDIYRIPLDGNNSCVIPHEMTDEPGVFYVGVLGSHDGLTRTSEVIPYDVVRGASVEGTNPSHYARLFYDAIDGTIEDLTDWDITKVRDHCFYGLDALKKVNLPNCTSVGEYAFWDCNNLISVSLPMCETIGQQAFYSCDLLEVVDLPKVTVIPTRGFYYCKNLVDVNFSLIEVGSEAFSGCDLLTNIDLSKVTKVGSKGFAHCDALTALDFRALQNIGTQAFSSCTNLRKIWIPSTCTDISASSYLNSPFSGCNHAEFKIFCEASAKPSGWGTHWNSISSVAKVEVVWGATHGDYLAY